MTTMNDKDWLSKVVLAAKVYNETRMHRDFQADEVNKFVDFLHTTYGYVPPNIRERKE